MLSRGGRNAPKVCMHPARGHHHDYIDVATAQAVFQIGSPVDSQLGTYGSSASFVCVYNDRELGFFSLLNHAGSRLPHAQPDNGKTNHGGPYFDDLRICSMNSFERSRPSFCSSAVPQK